MSKLSWVIGTATVSVLWLSISCGDGSNGEKLTIASSSVANSSSSNGAGGGDGGGASVSSSGAGGDPSGSGGMGGQGGADEVPINGCLSTSAVDLTAMDPANIDIPGGSYCIRVSQGGGLTFTLTPPADHRYLGGVYDDATQQKFPDATSPILSSCNASPYTCSPMVTNPPYVMVSKGAYPWYDDKNPATIKGVVYVE